MQPLEAPRLRVLQEDLLGALRGSPHGSRADAARTFLRPPAGDVGRRWEIYASGYLARLVEALENDYPAVRRILGDGPFRSLAARYIRRFPPRSFDIGRAGDRLALFLESDPLTADLPFLPDLARFEWSLSEAFVARDSEPLAWGDLAALGPHAVADATFHLRPGTALVRSPWPLVELRSATDLADEDVSIPLVPSPSTVLVYRVGLEVERRLVGEDDARFLETASRGLSLAELAAANVDAGASDVVERFRHWVAEGLFERPSASRDAAS